MDRHERLVRNELLLRGETARLHEVAFGRVFGGDESFVCECSRERCRTLLDLALADYRRMRTERGRFVIARGHEADNERVTEEYEGFGFAEARAVPGRRR